VKREIRLMQSIQNSKTPLVQLLIKGFSRSRTAMAKKWLKDGKKRAGVKQRVFTARKGIFLPWELAGK